MEKLTKIKIDKKKYNSEAGNLIDIIQTSNYYEFQTIDNLCKHLIEIIKNNLTNYYKKLESKQTNKQTAETLFWITENIKLINRIKKLHKQINYILKRPYDDFKPIPQLNHTMVCFSDYEYLNKYIQKLKAYLKKYNINKKDLIKLEHEEKKIINKFKER